MSAAAGKTRLVPADYTEVAKALKRNDDGISHASIDMLCALMEPMHQDYDLRQEQLNKSR